MTKRTYRVTIEPDDDAVALFWNGVAAGVLTYIVFVIAYWVWLNYWEDIRASHE